MDTEEIRKSRYIISAIANTFIGIFLILHFYHVYQVEPLYSYGLLGLSISFFIKAAADFIYAFNKSLRRKFHAYTAIHYLIASLILIYFKYFGIAVSFFFATILLLFAYYEYKHMYSLENEIYRVKRHIVATAFRWLMGSFIFFDSLFYNVVKPSLFGTIISTFGTLAGIYILYSALTTYRYIRDTSKVSILEAITTF